MAVFLPALAGLPGGLLAGGSGLNVAVVANQNSSNSLQLANYYCERRNVPPQNVLLIAWTGGNVEWSESDFDSNLLIPLQSMLTNRQLSGQIDYVVLSMDIPYRVNGSNGANSTTSALFYGVRANPPPCSLPDASSNSYAGSEQIFRAIAPGVSNGASWLATMITSSNNDLAQQIVDSGVSSDGTFPTQTVLLAKTTDTARNVRYLTFDNTIFNARLRGNYSIQRTNSDATAGLSNLLGFQTGLTAFTVSPNTFAPGAMADNLTSYGGDLFEATGQTPLLAFLRAGAAGSYGTVVEPCNYLQKFPSPQNYFYQARGFSLAECYYQSVTNPYLGVIVGEPLAAPFARSGSGSWNSPPPNGLLTGATDLNVEFIAADSAHPLQQVDLFVDGTLFQTLTNIAPAQGNVLHVSLPGQTNMSLTIPGGASLATIATSLAAALNDPTNQDFTMVRAFASGDRVELHSLAFTNGSQIPIAVGNAVGTASALTSFIQASQNAFLDSIASGILGFTVGGTPGSNDFLQLTVTLTNGVQSTISLTNSAGTTSVMTFVQSFLNAINAAPALQGVDGLTAGDLVPDVGNTVDFNLVASAPGLFAAQIQVTLTGSLSNSPSGLQTLTGNLSDLQPRNHIYLTAGATNLAVTAPFDTTTQPDGYHTLTAVAYEGSHVRVQTLLSQQVIISNSTLSAAFNALSGGTNVAVESGLQFSVAANTNAISSIQLFGSGGLLAAATNLSSAAFSVASSNLGVGLHPFYSIITRADGQQYRTQTIWIRVIGAEPPFSLTILGAGPTLLWPTTVGRQYQIFSSSNVTDAFQFRDEVTATNSLGQWSETAAPQRQFYRVSAY